ncbi:acyl-CoA Delta(11) desaturase-like isoform X1 [Photinus pyralis]|nr:acyl-CoA Delta(11) desaturase-like isoform X1 [Photinus pyralis]XP_031334556.1 acyl-CoA Delta(11) desaturase-like isoform X1 [Photinus pyralis]XP_031334557.1 acyl-CoA Delta(11) desaturase-like isoform X1 [Photinus pyralis]XP_031334558.1 acyl-CoA Delta(11) desaturase-like isoform X1 [Photinus pyralis]
MAPNLIGTAALFLAETTSEDTVVLTAKPSTRHQQTQVIRQPLKNNKPKYRWTVVWSNVLAFLYLHVGGLYGLYLLFFGCSWKTFLWTTIYLHVAGVGVTAGAHRLWAHRAYKAKLPMRIFLMICQTAAFQNHIYEWVRDHRVHHKFTDTDADPHNAKRGFFFSHIGWLMLKKHPDVKIKGRTVDMSDMEGDQVIQFQKKYYPVLVPLLAFILPAFVPWYFWGENGWVSWYTAGIFRYCFSLNSTWLVNSAAHIWGTKPYDKTIGPTQNLGVALTALGEGWHNYHHVFPWDYKAAELGNYRMNFTTFVIDCFSKIGWAYDLKTASIEMIEKRAKRTGDGSRASSNGDGEITNDHSHHHDDTIWGWGDMDMKLEDVQHVKVYNRLKET